MARVVCPQLRPYLEGGQCQSQTGTLPWGSDVAEGRATVVSRNFLPDSQGQAGTITYEYLGGAPEPPVVPGAVPGTLAAQGKLGPPSIEQTGSADMTFFLTPGPGLGGPGGGYMTLGGPGGGYPPTPIAYGGTQQINLGDLTGTLVDICTQFGVPNSICQLGGAAVENYLNTPPGGGGGGGGGGGCPEGYVQGPDGNCVITGNGNGGGDLSPGVLTPAEGAGQPVMGRYGVGSRPFTVGQVRGQMGVSPIRRCPDGMVLGKDNVCYNKNALRKSERKWPKPTRPLLTSGEMNAIRKASTAANRLLRTQRRLKKAGRVFGKL